MNDWNGDEWGLRGRPLMDRGAKEIFEMTIFSQEPLLYKFFSWRRASEIFFSRFPPAPPPDHQ